jgi:hypothetical protein
VVAGAAPESSGAPSLEQPEIAIVTGAAAAKDAASAISRRRDNFCDRGWPGMRLV